MVVGIVFSAIFVVAFSWYGLLVAAAVAAFILALCLFGHRLAGG